MSFKVINSESGEVVAEIHERQFSPEEDCAKRFAVEVAAFYSTLRKAGIYAEHAGILTKRYMDGRCEGTIVPRLKG